MERIGPLISILMPAYNVAGYIEESVRSILEQSFPDWELIIVDDCSTDGTQDVIRELAAKDKRIIVSFRNENSGKVHVPRLEAARLALGEFVIPIDADDKMAPRFLLEIVRSLFKVVPDLVIPEMWRFSDGEEPYRLLPKEDVEVDRLWSGRELVAYTLREWRIPMAGFACDRDLYLSCESEMTEEDNSTLYADELFSRILLYRSNKVAFCPGRYLYRINPDSITNVNISRYGSEESDRRLVEMMKRMYGVNSDERRLAEEQLFFGAVDALRISNRKGLTRDEIRHLVSHVSVALDSLDLSRLKGGVSGRYLALMSLPLSLARPVLRVIDYMMKKTGLSFRKS